MEKTVKLTIRLTPEDMELLKSHTAKTRLSQSAYLRKLIRGYVPKAYPPESFFELMQQLNRASGETRNADTYREILNMLQTLQETVTAPEHIDE